MPFFRTVDRWFRRMRRNAIRALLSGRRGRKLILESLPDEVTAVTMFAGDHTIAFCPHELIGRRIFTLGHYDRDLVDRVFSALVAESLVGPECINVVEIGANIGTQTIYFSLTGKVSKIVAIEPDPRNIGLLKRNIADNRLSAEVLVVECAIGADEGAAMLHRLDGNYGESTLLRNERSVDAVEVNVRPLDAVLSENAIDEREIGLIWMDIEGAEPLACASMVSLMRRQAPLVMEFSPELYGRAATEAFVGTLAAAYDRCIIYRRTGEAEIPVRDLPLSGEQVNVLLLPTRRQPVAGI